MKIYIVNYTKINNQNGCLISTHKGFLNKTAIIELTASDDIDQLNKGNYPRHLPEERRRISDFQLLIYDKLVEDNKIQKTINTFLLANTCLFLIA